MKDYNRLESVEFDGIQHNDSPDFSDAYITYAEWPDGTPLTRDELEDISSDVTYDYLMSHLY